MTTPYLQKSIHIFKLFSLLLLCSVNLSLFARGSNSAADYYNQGTARQGGQDYGNAVRYYSKAIEINPKYAEAYVGRGSCLVMMGHLREGLSDLDRAAKLKPSMADADALYYWRGNAKLGLKDYQGALKDLNRALQLKPDLAAAYHDRAIVKNRLNDPQGAIADYDKTLGLAPGNENVYVNRGLAKRTLKDYPGAIADYSKALELNPRNAKAYYNRAITLTESNGPKESYCPDFQRAQRLGIRIANEYSQLCLP